MKNRIRELREEQNIRQADLAKILGVRQNTLSTWETGRYEPDNEMLQKIASHFNTSVDYVLGRTPLRDSGVIDAVRMIHLVRTVENMAPDQFDATLNYAQEVLSGQKTLKIPVVGVVAAGVPIAAAETVIDHEEIDAQLAASGTFFGLKVRGDSMEPRVRDGDVVIVRRQETADTGDVAVVLVNGEDATVKRVKLEPDGSLWLLPNNPAYAPAHYSAAEIKQLPVTIVGVCVELRGPI